MKDPQPAPPTPEQAPSEPGETTLRLAVGILDPATRVSTPTLRVVAGPDLLHFARLSPNEVLLIGRDPEASLRLGDPTVSKRHAEVQVGADGRITVVDLGSTNGTAVNGRRIQRAALQPGDQLEVGSVSLRLDHLTADELSHLERVVERLSAAGRDSLTGLLDRSVLDEDLPQLGERCARSGVALSCIFIDIDGFKEINDTWGHRVGDAVLVAVARILMLVVRDADPCIRYGGEELLLVLPGSSLEDAAEVADRIRERICEHDWRRTAPGLQVTASFGVAERLPDEPLSDWLDRADRAMYRAKESGRNQVQRAQAPAPPTEEDSSQN